MIQHTLLDTRQQAVELQLVYLKIKYKYICIYYLFDKLNHFICSYHNKESFILKKKKRKRIICIVFQLIRLSGNKFNLKN